MTNPGHPQGRQSHPYESREIAAFIVALSIISGGSAFAQDDAPQKAVVELFTSQGCSSCPAADRVMQKLAARPDVIALTFSVDYWDYIGWKDTLATPENAQRQMDYAKRKPGGDGRVYTPQVIVNGMSCAPGNSESGINAAISKTSEALSAGRIEMKARLSGAGLSVDAAAASPGKPKNSGTLWLAAVVRNIDVNIQRGENEGRTVSYANNVSKLAAIGKWEGLAAQYQVPPGVLSKKADFYVVLLQSDGDGAIIGAAEARPD